MPNLELSSNNKKNSTTKESKNELGRRGIILLGSYLIIGACLLIYSLIAFAPIATEGEKPEAADTVNSEQIVDETSTVLDTTNSEETNNNESPDGDQSDEIIGSIGYLGFDISMPYEIKMLIFVAFAGAAGGQLYVMRKYWLYISMNLFKRSWLPSYFTKPVIGALTGLVLYLLIRGGFFSFSSESVSELNVYTFAALSALAGMFTKDIMIWLKTIIEKIFTTETKKESDEIEP